MWELDDASDELRRVALEFVKIGTNNCFLHYPHKSPKAAAQTLEGHHTPAGIACVGLVGDGWMGTSERVENVPDSVARLHDTAFDSL